MSRLGLALACLYFALVGASLFSVISSPLGVVYLSMPPLFLPLYFFATLFLLSLIFFTKMGANHRIFLVVTHAFLSHFYFTIQFYPGIGGDQWIHLAYERSIANGWLTSRIAAAPFPLFAKTYLMIRDSMQYTLVITLSRIFAVDIYWVHIVFVPVLWSIFGALLGFRIANEIGANDKVSALSGFLVGAAPIFISWGSVSVPNSLGFLVFLFSLYSFLRCFYRQRRTDFVLALVSVLLCFLSYPTAGMASLSLMMIYVAMRVKDHSAMRLSISAGLTAAATITIPLSLVVFGSIYPLPSYFSIAKFLSFNVYQLILTGYEPMVASKFLSYASVELVGVLGMILFYPKSKTKNLFMGLSFLSLVLQYQIVFYFIDPVPFGPERLWTLRDFVLAPYTAIVIGALLSWITAKKALDPFGFNNFGTFATSKVLRRNLLISLVVLIAVSSLVSDGLLRSFDYERYFTPGGRVTVSQIDAMKAIQSQYLKDGESYVVVTDYSTSTWGAGIEGFANPHGTYLLYNASSYNSLVGSPAESLTFLVQAVAYARKEYRGNYTVVYLLVSRAMIEVYTGKDFDSLTKDLASMLETFYVSSDSEVYVYRLNLPLTSNTGTGPNLEVIKGGVESSVPTEYSFTTQDKVSYTLRLSGSLQYNITAWPIYWIFQDVQPIPKTSSIDANSWINFTGSPATTYVVQWTANEFYKDRILWRDDSFLGNWEFFYGWGNWSFTSDGSVAIETVRNKPTQYVMYRQRLPPLQNVGHLIARLKGTSNADFHIALWDESKEVFYVWWTRATPDYKLYSYSLPENVTLSYFVLTARTTDGAPASIFWDYVALSS